MKKLLVIIFVVFVSCHEYKITNLWSVVTTVSTVSNPFKIGLNSLIKDTLYMDSISASVFNSRVFHPVLIDTIVGDTSYILTRLKTVEINKTNGIKIK